VSQALDPIWREQLAELEQAGLLRSLRTAHGMDFCSNDYLGLSQHPEVAAAAFSAIATHGPGSPSSRLLRGESELHAQAEQACAEWQNCEAALLFPSGYQANLGWLTALTDKSDCIFSDALNHASLIDGARLSRSSVQVYRHCELAHLDELLGANACEGRRWVVSERVFSMDGDLAPVDDLLALCEKHDAHLVIDDAHGAGLFPALAAHPRLAARVVTGGKALGLAGAFVAGSSALREILINRSRSFIFTTACPPPLAASLTAAIRIARQDSNLARAALARAEQLRSGLQARGLATSGESAIVPWVIGSERATLDAAQRLQDRGFDARAVRPPTVPAGTSRIRFVCRAQHSESDIQELLHAIDYARASPAWVVAGTDTEIGKTVVSTLLMRAWQRRGTQPEYLKPIQTGDDDDAGQVRQRLGLSLEQVPEPSLALSLPVSPDQAARAEGMQLDPRAIEQDLLTRVNSLERGPLIIECAGGLRVPITDDYEQIDLLEAARLPTVLVARTALGTLNHSLLSIESLQARDIPLLAVILVGERHAANEESLRQRIGDTPLLHLPVLANHELAAYDQALDNIPIDDLYT